MPTQGGERPQKGMGRALSAPKPDNPVPSSRSHHLRVRTPLSVADAQGPELCCADDAEWARVRIRDGGHRVHSACDDGDMPSWGNGQCKQRIVCSSDGRSRTPVHSQLPESDGSVLVRRQETTRTSRMHGRQHAPSVLLKLPAGRKLSAHVSQKCSGVVGAREEKAVVAEKLQATEGKGRFEGKIERMRNERRFVVMQSIDGPAKKVSVLVLDVELVASTANVQNGGAMSLQHFFALLELEIPTLDLACFISGQQKTRTRCAGQEVKSGHGSCVTSKEDLRFRRHVANEGDDKVPHTE